MLTRNDIENTVIDLAKRHASNVSIITSESKLTDDLGLGHDYMYLLIDLERRYGRKIPPAEFKSISTVSDLVELYYKHLAG